MAKYKIKFICLLLLFSFPVLGEKKQCASLKGEIKRIQNLQTSHKAFGTTAGEMQKSYDENMAQLILLKGLKEMKDNFWRSKGLLKNSQVDKEKISELSKKLEESIKASSKILAMDDLLVEVENKKSLLETDDSREFLKQLQRRCKKKENELCNDLKNDKGRFEPLARGFSTSIKIAKGSPSELKENLSLGLPDKKSIADEMNLEKRIKRDLKRLNKCLEEKRNCKPELSLVKERVDSMNNALENFKGIEENKNRIELEDTFGDLETLVKSLELEGLKEKKSLNEVQKKTLKNLNKKVKSNFEVANIRKKIRGEKFSPDKPPEVTDKSARSIYKDLFKKIGCKKINDCLKKLGPQNNSLLEKEISKVENKIDQIVVNLDKVSQDEDFKNLDEMKAVLVSLAQDECREIKTEEAHPGFITCDLDMTKVSPNHKVNKFAFQIGRVMAEVDKDLFVDENTPKLEKEKRLKALCKKDYKMRASSGKSSAFCYSLYPDLKKSRGKKVSKKFKSLFESDEEKIMKKCGPAKRCMDWIAFYERYDVTRDETGKGVAVQKIPSWSELIAPNLAKSVTTLLPVGLEMYQSDYYLKEMQNQAAHQMEVNYYRENWPIHTYFWDMGYRGFDDGYVGGPTLGNPGVAGIGAIGNPYQGVGAWNPYGLSGVTPAQQGLYNFNPYFNGNFQNGNTYSYGQLSY